MRSAAPRISDLRSCQAPPRHSGSRG
jgi:hypothetical protein